MATRQASAAGAFYPGQKAALLKQVEGFFKGLPKEKKSRCIVAPHAGYDYSGKTAAAAFNALQESKTFAIMSPNHSGLGEPISVSDADYWETPLGKVPVNAELKAKLLSGLGIEADGLAHMDEHSIEVQLPFLQCRFKGFSILPVTLMTSSLEELLALGNALAKLEGISVIASGDFTHFEPLEAAKEKDLNAIGLINRLDAEGFHRMVMERHLSICGVSPITALIQYCRQKGLTKGKLLKYDTSASGTGDTSSVVGYAAIKFE